MKRRQGYMLLLIVGLFLSGIGQVFAQNCPAIVQQALENIQTICTVTERNQVCYGNSDIQILEYEGVPALDFDTVGDIEELVHIQRFQLSALSEQNNTWGVMWLQVQASLENSFPHDITILMFGTVDMQNLVRPLVVGQPAYIHTTEGDELNVRTAPSTASPVLVALTDGTPVTVVDGPIDNSGFVWWKIRLANGAEGFVVASVDDNGERLPTLVRDNGIYYGPIEAVTLMTGVDDNLCSTVPESGVLIQTPEGAGEITLLINEVEISFGSTLFIQAVPDGDMIVNLIEGSATVNVNSTLRTLTDGQRVRIPMTGTQMIPGIPSFPEPIDPDDYLGLPLHVLPEPIIPIVSGPANLMITDVRATQVSTSIYTVTVDVLNAGGAPSASTNVLISIAGSNLTFTSPLDTIASGEMRSVDVQVSRIVSQVQAYAVVDTLGNVDESNEVDNAYEFQIPQVVVIQ